MYVYQPGFSRETELIGYNFVPISISVTVTLLYISLSLSSIYLSTNLSIIYLSIERRE